MPHIPRRRDKWCYHLSRAHRDTPDETPPPCLRALAARACEEGAGVSQAFIGQLETCTEDNPTLATLRKLAKAFGGDADNIYWLTKGTELGRNSTV